MACLRKMKSVANEEAKNRILIKNENRCYKYTYDYSN